MIVQPVKEDAEGYSKEEIKPLFEDTPALQGLITESKARNTSSNTILLMYKLQLIQQLDKMMLRMILLQHQD